MAVRVRYKSLYISLPSSAKQQREMTNSALSEEREVRQLFFLKFCFKFIEVSQIQFRESFDSDKVNDLRVFSRKWFQLHMNRILFAPKHV